MFGNGLWISSIKGFSLRFLFVGVAFLKDVIEKSEDRTLAEDVFLS